MHRTIIPLLFLAAVGCSDDDADPTGAGGSAASGTTSTSTTTTGGGTTTSQVRVAHLSPDAPPVDFCFRSAGGDVLGPILEGAGLSDGIAFGQVTPYLPSEEGTYTVQVILATAADCTQPVVEVPNVVVPGGGLEITTAAIGLTAAMPPTFELIFLLDENLPTADEAKLRCVHAAPNVGAVDVGVLPAGSDQLAAGDVAFSAIEYKGTAQPAYVNLDPLNGVTLRAQTSDDPAVGVELDGVTLEAGVVATAFAIGLPHDLQVLLCRDTEGNGSCQLQ